MGLQILQNKIRSHLAGKVAARQKLIDLAYAGGRGKREQGDCKTLFCPNLKGDFKGDVTGFFPRFRGQAPGGSGSI